MKNVDSCVKKRWLLRNESQKENIYEKLQWSEKNSDFFTFCTVEWNCWFFFWIGRQRCLTFKIHFFLPRFQIHFLHFDYYFVAKPRFRSKVGCSKYFSSSCKARISVLISRWKKRKKNRKCCAQAIYLFFDMFFGLFEISTTLWASIFTLNGLSWGIFTLISVETNTFLVVFENCKFKPAVWFRANNDKADTTEYIWHLKAIDQWFHV